MVNKKGFFFSIVAIVLVMIILVVLNLKISNQSTNQFFGQEIRINSMNSFLIDLERDMNRAVYITSFRVINALNNDIAAKGEYIDSFNLRFEEAFFNGTIYSEESGVMVNSTFSDWILRVNNIAESYAININITPISIDVTLNDPWTINVSLNSTIYAYDYKNLTAYNYSHITSTTLDIIGLEDPVYTIISHGRLYNKINSTKVSSFTNNQDTSNLMHFINHSEYIPNTLAPDFIMRMEGNFSSSDNGIESIIYFPNFAEQGIPYVEKSMIDYLYAGNFSPVLNTINNTYESWLRIDNSHLYFYQVENLTI
jgi:hypothetical protein